MVTKFNFWHWKSNRRLARQDKRLARQIHGLKLKMDALKKSLKDAEVKGMVGKISKDSMALAKALDMEIKNLFQIATHAQMQNYDLIKHLNHVVAEMDKALKKAKTQKRAEVPPDLVARRTQDLEKIKKDVEDLKKEAHTQILKAKQNFDRVRADRGLMLKYTNMLGLNFLVREIRAKEYDQSVKARRVDDEVLQIEKAVKPFFKNTAKNAKIYTDEEIDLVSYAEEFVRDAKAEIDDIYHIELNSAVFLLFLQDIVKWLNDFFARINKKGYPVEKIRASIDFLHKVSDELESHLTDKAQGFTYLRRMAGGGALAA